MKLHRKHKINWIRLGILLSFIFMVSGFRLIDASKRWAISESDPYLWVKHCNWEQTFKNQALPINDPLANNTNITMRDALQSFVDDVNHIYGSYLRVELYPTDPDNPPAGSTFTRARAEKRTIELCNGSSSALAAGGSAQPEWEDDQIVKCTINYAASSHDDVKEFLRLAFHEIGHCFGLGHPQEITHAIMSYYANSSLYRYQPDDIIGLRYLFPAQIDGIDHREHATYGLSCTYQ